MGWLNDIFKGAKDILKSPIGQIGIGLLLPGMGSWAGAGGLKGFLGGIGSFAAKNPMLTQAGLGLLAGDKPQNVLRNLGYGAAASGIMGLGQPGGFMGGVKEYAGIGSPATTGSMTDAGYTVGAENVGGAKKPGFLESIKSSLVKKGEGLDFFEKYSPLLKMGYIGASILAATLSKEDLELLYDPKQNPYLKSGTAEEDWYKNVNPYYEDYFKGKYRGGNMSFSKGGIDNLRKSGMVEGPGGPKEDLIDAKLSNGEFVWTAAAVDKAGGPKIMYEMMNKLDPDSETYEESLMKGGIA